MLFGFPFVICILECMVSLLCKNLFQCYLMLSNEESSAEVRVIKKTFKIGSDNYLEILFNVLMKTLNSIWCDEWFNVHVLLCVCVKKSFKLPRDIQNNWVTSHLFCKICFGMKGDLRLKFQLFFKRLWKKWLLEYFLFIDKAWLYYKT